MIKGNIEIFQSYGNSHKSLYKGSNMVVDGFRKTVADVMTYMPNPSGGPIGGAGPIGASSVSSYQIQAMTLGSAKESYNQRGSRYWYSSIATSGNNYQLAPLNDNSVFEMWDCYSGIGFNQWKYDNVVDANLLTNPTLKNLNGWTVNYLNNVSGAIQPQTDITSEGEIDITKFELLKGQQQVTLRQSLPTMELGGVYTFYTNGKAYNATMDIRISRGRNDVPVEYYNFSTEKFESLDRDNKNFNHTISLKDYYDVNEFRVKLRGNKRDQAFSEYQQFFVEYVFPSFGFIDTTFAPWEQNYVNPYINIIRLEVCDERNQILRNPNFLEHQSQLVNNDFDITAQFPSTEAANPTACTQAGLFKLPGWNQLNPLVKYSNDPGNRETANGLGAVFPLATDSGRIFSGVQGVSLYTSSNDLASSGTAFIEQTFNLGNDFRNKFAFTTPLTPDPNLLDQANTQYDNNATMMLSFDTMVSGQSTAANCGNLEITLVRDSDGFEYNFAADPVTQINNVFSPNGSPLKISYDAKETWYQNGVQVMLPADASQQTYSLNIRGTGRTDANGFCYYSIRNFCFGPLAGWRTYVFDQSGVAKWSLSSTGCRVSSGNIYSGLMLSSTRYASLPTDSYAKVRNSINLTQAPTKTQLVQNFAGLEPTKTYRLAVKGTMRNTAQVPGFSYILKAKARTSNPNNYNLLSLWMRDSLDFSATNTPTNLNPYSTNSLATRATHPFFCNDLASNNTTPLDWGLYVGASDSGEQNYIVSEDLRANPGEYTLSMNVFNETDAGSYFVLSSTNQLTSVFFNWDTGEWEDIVSGEVPSYRNSTSGSYFLKLPDQATTEKGTKYTYPKPIVFPEVEDNALTFFDDKTLDGEGSRGAYKFTAALYGPNAEAGRTLVSDLALDGPGLGPAVDVWKELYYNFTGQNWQPTPVSANDYYSQDLETSPESFISTPQSLISKMCLYGLDRDTEYQLNIVDTSGGIYCIHDVSLQDAALVNNSGRSRWIRDPKVWTTEPYGQTHYDDYLDGAVFKLSNITTGTTKLLSNTTSPSAMTAWTVNGSMMFRATSGDTGTATDPGIIVPTTRVLKTRSTAFAPWLTQNFTLDEYGLSAGSMFAVGLEAIGIDSATDKVSMSIAAKYNGVRYTYNPVSQEWNPGVEREVVTTTLYDRGAQSADEFYADAKTWNQLLSPKIPVPTFGPATKITASFRMESGGAALRSMDIKDFKVYKWTDATPHVYRVSGDTFNFPEFPKPADTTLQPVQVPGKPGELGHFLNRINFFKQYPAKLKSQATGANPDVSGIRAINNPMSPSVTGEKTLEEAVTMGAYLPSAGLFFGSGTFGVRNTQQAYGLSPSAGLVSGVLNQMGVVNSDGYIYRHPHAPTNNDARDASAGFLVSSFSSTVGASYGGYGKKTLRYILKLHKDDWRFLDYYMGGLGAIGLNSLDYKKTYAKLGTGYQISGTGASYSAGSRVRLYKIADPTKNPIFNLTNKKVTFPPGLKIDYDNTDHITIIWDINY